jgi:hypothetical protein
VRQRVPVSTRVEMDPDLSLSHTHVRALEGGKREGGNSTKRRRRRGEAGGKAGGDAPVLARQGFQIFEFQLKRNLQFPSFPFLCLQLLG